MTPRRAAGLLSLIVALMAGPADAAWALSRPALARRVHAVFAASPLPYWSTGIVVSATGESDNVVRINAAKRFIPASAMKVVTASAALDKLGPYYRFKTYVSSESTPTTSGAINGDIYLVGCGDPTLATRARKRQLSIPGSSYLDDMADGLKRRGITHIKGSIVADESFFDRRRIGNGWKPSYRAYCPPLSALTVDRNIGGPAGCVREPAANAGYRLRAMLLDRDIKVGGGVRVSSEPTGTHRLAAEWSAPLYRIVAPMGVASDNFTAEMLLKSLGKEEGAAGSTYQGGRVAAKELVAAGVPSTHFRVVDGSGLSRYNQLTPAALDRLLRYASGRTFGRYLYMALPTAAKTGTLAGRMRGTEAAGVTRAKTGTLSGVSTLAGYVDCRSGIRFSFAVMTNRGSVSDARALQDRICRVLAAHSGR